MVQNNPEIKVFIPKYSFIYLTRVSYLPIIFRPHYYHTIYTVYFILLVKFLSRKTSTGRPLMRIDTHMPILLVQLKFCTLSVLEPPFLYSAGNRNDLTPAWPVSTAMLKVVYALYATFAPNFKCSTQNLINT